MNQEIIEQVNNNLLKIEELMEKNIIIKGIADELEKGVSWNAIAITFGFIKIKEGICEYMTEDEVLRELRHYSAY